ncbi:MAG TPA: hypothetical protein PKM63_02915 [Panacibacter sp.]|nr:hypothetical protein [Panacibacter sp.]HNP43209.1 hypothetical protein [Panacibacter sp.]
MKAFLKLPAALLLLAVVIASFSCNKTGGGSTTQYFVSAKIDGTELKNVGFTVATFADLTAIGLKTCTIQGSESAVSTSNLLNLVVVDNAPITTKQYTAINISGLKQASINYTDKNGAVFSSDYSPLADAVITVTGITVNDVVGTFSGTVSNVSGTSSISITDGSFLVKRLY